MEKVRPRSGREAGLGHAVSGQRANGRILFRMWHGHPAGLPRVGELKVRTFRMAQHPTLGLKPFNDISAMH